jgi:excisionase family DNA binding protein
MILETLQKRETVMNIHEVANLLGLSESLVYRMAASYQIPCVRFCGALRFDPSELAAWYEERLEAHPPRKPPCAEPLRGHRISIAS